MEDCYKLDNKSGQNPNLQKVSVFNFMFVVNFSYYKT